MPRFLSTELGLQNEIDDIGAFDILLDIDSNYFINIKRLKETEIPEFVNSYNEINEYFRQIGILLLASTSETDRAYKTALQKFKFPEVNGIGLGFSKGKHGSGFGDKLKKIIIHDAKEIITMASNQPEIFHLIGLFENNVGPDRLSDMIARIIYPSIFKYTIRINKELGIIPSKYPHLNFDNEGIICNPYKDCKVLLLPRDILHELPIARDWDDIDRVCRENEVIKAEINEMVGEQWGKIATHVKKEYIKKYIFKKPSTLNRLLEDYRKTKVEAYDFNKDSGGDYLVAKRARKLPAEYPLEIISRPRNSKEISMLIINKFKDLVENNKVYELLYSDGKPRGEKIVQRAFLCVAESYCEANNLDVSPESDAGRGPVDFKMSNGLDKTIVEIKLTSNSNVVHGFEVQIEEYAKAEKTENKIFLIIDNGGPKTRIEGVIKIYESKKENKENVPEVIIIDAKPKESASKYNK